MNESKNINCALMLCDDGSPWSAHGREFLVLGRPMATYPLVVALSCRSIAEVFVCSGRAEIRELAANLGAKVLDGPKPGQAFEQTVAACVEQIGVKLRAQDAVPLCIVLLRENALTVTPQLIETGLTAMAANSGLNAAMTVSSSVQWSPQRAHRIGADGILKPVLPAGSSSLDEAWFPDHGATIVRAADIAGGKWLGGNVLALRQEGFGPVTEMWHLGGAEAWIKAHELDNLFRTKRTRWAHFYDSERSLLSAVHLTRDASVLDIGTDPGGLGTALRERFGIAAYTAVVPKKADGGEVRAIYPEAKVVVGDVCGLNRLTTDGFDLVAALGISDSGDFLERTLPAAYAQLMEFGSLVFNVRLTTGPEIGAAQQSYQEISVGRGESLRRPYVVRNVQAVLAAVRGLRPARVVAHGYMGRPSPTASTTLRELCFAVFAVTKAGEAPPAEPTIDLQLPPEYRK